MKSIAIFALMMSLSTAAHANTKSVLKSILDKELKNDFASATIHGDGTVSGIYKGKSWTGTWKLKGGKYCRQIPAFNSDMCQKIKAVKDKSGKLIGVEFLEKGKKEGNKYFF